MDYENGVKKLPEHMRKPVLDWIEEGRKPGRFLTAVLQNDLYGAAVGADDKNLEALPAYARFLYHDAPSECFGSIELFDRWAKMGGLTGISNGQPRRAPLDL